MAKAKKEAPKKQTVTLYDVNEVASEVPKDKVDELLKQGYRKELPSK